MADVSLSGKNLELMLSTLQRQALAPIAPTDDPEMQHYRTVSQRIREAFFSHILQLLREEPDIREHGLSRQRLFDAMMSYHMDLRDPTEPLENHPGLAAAAEADIRKNGHTTEDARVLMPADDAQQQMRNVHSIGHHISLDDWRASIMRTYATLLGYQQGNKAQILDNVRQDVRKSRCA